MSGQGHSLPSTIRTESGTSFTTHWQRHRCTTKELNILYYNKFGFLGLVGIPSAEGFPGEPADGTTGLKDQQVFQIGDY